MAALAPRSFHGPREGAREVTSLGSQPCCTAVVGAPSAQPPSEAPGSLAEQTGGRGRGGGVPSPRRSGWLAGTHPREPCPPALSGRWGHAVCALSPVTATSHTWPGSTWKVASMSEDLNLSFCLIYKPDINRSKEPYSLKKGKKASLCARGPEK